MEPFNTVSVKYMTVDNKEHETIIELYDYTEKSIVMKSDDYFGKCFTENLKPIGKYNPNLKIGKGWLFAKTKYSNLQQLISDIMELKIKGAVPYTENKIDVSAVSGPLGFLPPPEPLIINELRKVLNRLDNKGFDKHTNGSKTYVWGEKEAVMKETENTKATIELKTSTHMLIMF